MTRFRGNLRISDLSSPTVLGVTVVVRFTWNMGDAYVKVMTAKDDRTMTRHEARLCWKQFRKAGYKPTDDTLIAADGGFISNAEIEKFDSLRATGSKLFSDAEKIEEEKAELDKYPKVRDIKMLIPKDEIE